MTQDSPNQDGRPVGAATPSLKPLFDNEARLSWVLAALAGLVGAAAFTHTEGYFVTFMTGNTERAVLGHFRGESGMAFAAAGLLGSFVLGVVVAMWCRRRYWSAHPHSVTVLTTVCLGAATVLDQVDYGFGADEVTFGPIALVAFAIGALNTSFVKNGEVSVPLSYVTGTAVKLGQGIERHLSGGSAADWLGYFLLYVSFVLGAVLGGVLSRVMGGAAMLATATVVCAVTTVYTRMHALSYGPLPE
jgi:uncharacterized membrane protein YoaK (UPF0700 family)